jgi:ribosomal protein L1
MCIACCAQSAGADVIGDEELIASIIEGGSKAVTFDKLIATPEFMKPLAKAGKLLGPKGLMPNVKVRKGSWWRVVRQGSAPRRRTE